MTISAKIIADSVSLHTSKRITTFELEYPRFIHSEFMTHRLFSRNAASSRAIPVDTSIKLIKENMAMPVHWGKNQPGMSAKEECTNNFIRQEPVIDGDGNFILQEDGSILTKDVMYTREQIWEMAGLTAIEFAEWFNESKYHKQIVNRLMEPFTHIKVVLTATELDNFFWLRNHKDAQPEIHELARVMLEAYNSSVPVTLKNGEWHLPYYMSSIWKPSSPECEVDIYGHTLHDARAISASCCAQVSYRKADESLDKALVIYNRLVESMPPHFSPFEHQATPMPTISAYGTDSNNIFSTAGVTHLDCDNQAWSGNFKHWIQYRQILMLQLNIDSMTSIKR